MRTTVIWMYHLGCGIWCVNLEACGDGQSPGGAATMVKSMQKQVAQCVGLGEVGAAVNKVPGWGCNNREIVAIKVCCERGARPNYQKCSRIIEGLEAIEGPPLYIATWRVGH